MPSSEQRHAESLLQLYALDQALVHHAQWLANLNRQLICGGEANPNDLAEDAHLRCSLGRWLHGEEALHANADAQHALLMSAHQTMHEIAGRLLRIHAANQLISLTDYDALVVAACHVRQLLRHKEQSLIEQVSAVDKLTGLWNRQAVLLRLEEEIERTQRTRMPCVICFVDMDHFVRVNQMHGQAVGDKVLKAISGFLAQQIRGSDALFRLGGEEFLLFLPNLNLSQAGVRINRVRENLAAHTFVVDGHSIQLTASFGVVSLEPIFFVNETLERVERAQQIAKSDGGNRVCIWHDGFEDLM